MDSMRLSRTLFAVAILACSALLGDARPPAPRAPAIARIWKGRTLAAKAHEYQRYLDSTGISRILASAGNRGVTVLRRAQGAEVEFTVISIWDSLEAVKSFAGADYRKAVVLPRDREYLVSVETEVVHCEIIRDERRERM